MDEGGLALPEHRVRPQHLGAWLAEFLVLLLVLSTASASAMMPEPPSLRELIESADVIAVTRTVTDTCSTLPFGDPRRQDTAQATLEVERCIKCPPSAPRKYV